MFKGGFGYRNDGDAGLHHVAARYYDAQVGRFITRDTLLSEHPYAYCSHDPINNADPSGHNAIAQAVKIAWPFIWRPAAVALAGVVVGASIPAWAVVAIAAAVILVGAYIYSKGLPWQGAPNSTAVKDDGRGNGQIRDYGPDGYPIKDFDFGHNHPPYNAGDPHAHDWGRPPGGGPPRNEDRGDPRPIGPGE